MVWTDFSRMIWDGGGGGVEQAVLPGGGGVWSRQSCLVLVALVPGPLIAVPKWESLGLGFVPTSTPHPDPDPPRFLVPQIDGNYCKKGLCYFLENCIYMYMKTKYSAYRI